MAKLVQKIGAGAGREFSLTEGLNRIGRAPGNEIRIDDHTVSSTHCELWLMKERLLLRDLGSTNGTFVGSRAVSEVEVQQGDVVTVGGIELLVDEAPGRVSIPKAPEPLPPPPKFTPDGDPCCVNHLTVSAHYRCPKCGEQYCDDCVRILGRRGSTHHAYCPPCSVECVSIVPPRIQGPRRVQPAQSKSWLAKLTQTLKIRP